MKMAKNMTMVTKQKHYAVVQKDKLKWPTSGLLMEKKQSQPESIHDQVNNLPGLEPIS